MADKERESLRSWSEIEDREWGELFLGNGASIACYDGFNYKTLKEVAEKNGYLSGPALKIWRVSRPATSSKH
jgi:hypothetical protein